MGKLGPRLWMSKLRLRAIAGEMWKVLGFHSVFALQQGSHWLLLIHFKAKTEVLESPRDSIRFIK